MKHGSTSYLLYLLVVIGFIGGSCQAVDSVSKAKWCAIIVHGLRAWPTEGRSLMENAFKQWYGDEVYVLRPKYSDGIEVGTPKAARANFMWQARNIDQQIKADKNIYDAKTGKYKLKAILFLNSLGVNVGYAYYKQYHDPKNPFIDMIISTLGSLGGHYGLPRDSEMEPAVKEVVDVVTPLRLERLKPVLVKVFLGITRCCFPYITPCFYTSCFQKGTCPHCSACPCCCLPCCPFPKGFAVFNYLHAPNHLETYLANAPLAKLNNEVEHGDSKKFKDTMQITEHVSLGSSDDPILTDASPSCFWLTPQEIVELRKKGENFTDKKPYFTLSKQYKENLLGLKDLYDYDKSRDIADVKDFSGKKMGVKDAGGKISFFFVEEEHSGVYKPEVLYIVAQYIEKSRQRILAAHASNQQTKKFELLDSNNSKISSIKIIPKKITPDQIKKFIVECKQQEEKLQQEKEKKTIIIELNDDNSDKIIEIKT